MTATVRAMTEASPPAGLADADAAAAEAVPAGTRASPRAPPHLAVVAAQPRRAAALVHPLTAPPAQARDHALRYTNTWSNCYIRL